MESEDCPALSRREARRQDKRDAIIAVAAASFLEHGYAGTTMSGIAGTLGGSKGTLWSYFSSKEELFAAVLDNVTTAYRARLSELLDSSSDFSQTLRRFCSGIMLKVVTSEAVALHRLVLGEAGRFPEMGRIFYDRAPRQTHKLLAAFLEAAMERGELCREDPQRMARFLINMCMADCHQQLLTGVIDTVDIDRITADVNRAVDVFLASYGAKPPPQE